MSAWIVSKAHIDAMVDAAMAGTYDGGLAWYTTDAHGGRVVGHEIKPGEMERANEVGQMLWTENVASIEYLYGKDEDYRPEATGYRFAFPATRHPALHILKAIRCYEYQSCEHPEWETSEAKRFCDHLTAKMVSQLPGYDDAPWGIG